MAGKAVTGNSWTTGDSLTAAKLNAQFTGSTLTGIVNADLSGTAGITDANLAQISTASKVASSAITGALAPGNLGSAATSFSVNPASMQSDIVAGSAVDVVWGTEIWDTGGNFASNTFTAPTTGKYLFTVSLIVDSIDAASTALEILLVTTGGNVVIAQNLPNLQYVSDTNDTFNWTGLVAMTATNTAKVTINFTGGDNQADIQTSSRFSGTLV